MSGLAARQLVWQERSLLANIPDSLLEYVWGDDTLHRDLDLRSPTHWGVVLDEIHGLTNPVPCQLSLQGMREPIAVAIAFIACRCLARIYDVQSRLPQWATLGWMAKAIEMSISAEVNTWAREQVYWRGWSASKLSPSSVDLGYVTHVTEL